MLFFRISVQLSMGPLMQSAIPSTLEQLPVYFYLITGRIQLDCFDRSVHSQCALCNKARLKIRQAFFVLTVVYEQCYDE